MSYSIEIMKKLADYDNLPYTESVTLVKRAGSLEKYETYQTGYIETAIKITKNYAGPKIEFLRAAGLMKINSGETPIESVDFSVFGAQASAHASRCDVPGSQLPGSICGVGYEAKVVLAGGSVSIFDLQLALGISSQIGIVDDSLEIKIFGLGGSVGRKTQLCALDVCFGVDFGRLGRR